MKTDRNGKLGVMFSGIANWATRNSFSRRVLQRVAGVDAAAALPAYASQRLTKGATARHVPATPQVPSSGVSTRVSDVVIYATCYGEFNTPETGHAFHHILQHAGIGYSTVHPECCGMPQLEGAEIKTVADKAARVAAYFAPMIREGKKIVTLVPSCALMLKGEWPGILPDNPDVALLAAHVSDLAEYLVHGIRAGEIPPPPLPLSYSVGLHIPCHARAQNIGPKARDMLQLIDGLSLQMIERCSGHGGSWGIMQGNHAVAMKQARPVAKKLMGASVIVSECPLGGLHLAQAVQAQAEPGQAEPGQAEPAPAAGSGSDTAPVLAAHPVLLLAEAYGFAPTYQPVASV